MEIDPSSETGELERKRENRLTNIVDQLLHSKASRSSALLDVAKVERGSGIDAEKSAATSRAPDSKTRRKKLAQQRLDHIKDERCSPELDRTGSPHTPSPNSSLIRTPPAPAMDGLHMSRNYSDFMRSLAAKYNNNSAASADYGRFDSRAFKGSIGDPGSSASAAISALAAFPQFAFPGLVKEAEDAKSRDKDFVPSFALPALDASHPALPGFPMMDMSSTQALLSMVRSASSRNMTDSYVRPAALKRPAETTHSPLDLSSPPVKRPDMESLPVKKKYLQTEEKLASPREKRTPTPKAGQQFNCRSTCTADSCSPAAVEVNGWSVGEVVDFVRNIDLCSEYAEAFREHSIDGATLPLLTEDHLTAGMGMKLGPALKLRSALAKRIGHCAVCLHCAHCHADNAAQSAQGGQE